jgi:DNA-binding XRE family transcriptional regulator
MIVYYYIKGFQNKICGWCLCHLWEKGYNEMEKKDLQKIFSENIRKHIKNKGLNQKDLAKKISVSPSSMNSYFDKYASNDSQDEKPEDVRQSLPELYTAVKIAKALDVSLDMLCGLDELCGLESKEAKKITNALELIALLCESEHEGMRLYHGVESIFIKETGEEETTITPIECNGNSMIYFESDGLYDRFIDDYYKICSISNTDENKEARKLLKENLIKDYIEKFR